MKFFNIQAIGDHQSLMANVGSKTTYGGASVTTVSAFTANEIGVFVGIVIGIAGFLMNWYYSRKRDRREEAEHEMRLQEIREAHANGK
jgi:hypothetical protein